MARRKRATNRLHAAGAVALVAGLVLALSFLPDATGVPLVLGRLQRIALGNGAWVIPLAGVLSGIALLRASERSRLGRRACGAALVVLVSMTAYHARVPRGAEWSTGLGGGGGEHRDLVGNRHHTCHLAGGPGNPGTCGAAPAIAASTPCSSAGRRSDRGDATRRPHWRGATRPRSRAKQEPAAPSWDWGGRSVQAGNAGVRSSFGRVSAAARVTAGRPADYPGEGQNGTGGARQAVGTDPGQLRCGGQGDTLGAGTRGDAVRGPAGAGGPRAEDQQPDQRYRACAGGAQPAHRGAHPSQVRRGDRGSEPE